MNKSEARSFETLAQFLAGLRPADDTSAITAARHLAQRAGASLRAAVVPKVERHLGETRMLGPEPVPRPGDDVERWLRTLPPSFGVPDVLADYRLHAAIGCPLDYVLLGTHDPLGETAREEFARVYPDERVPW